jgi:hypothetical protein
VQPRWTRLQHWPSKQGGGRRRRTRADSPAEERLGELKRTVARWLMHAGWSSEQVEGFCTVHGESDGGAAGFYWGADGSRDPSGGAGGVASHRLAATFATLGANGLHIHQLVPQSRAQMGELRTAWARAARVDADASMSRGTAIRTARRAAEATAEERRRRRRRRRQRRRSCCWASSEPTWPPQLLLFASSKSLSIYLSI